MNQVIHVFFKYLASRFKSCYHIRAKQKKKETVIINSLNGCLTSVYKPTEYTLYWRVHISKHSPLFISHGALYLTYVFLPVMCSLQVSIGCPEKMEPITKVSHIPASRWALSCSLCREHTGTCIQVRQLCISCDISNEVTLVCLNWKVLLLSSGFFQDLLKHLAAHS